MLAAFARLTGAPFLHTNLLQERVPVTWRMAGHTARLILEDSDDRDIELWGDTSNDERRIAEMSEGFTGRVLDWHFSVAIRLSDGRWVHLDPYMHDFGIFGEAWDLDENYRLLNKYNRALPGLTIVGNDRGALESACAGAIDGLKAYIQHSNAMQQICCEDQFCGFLEKETESKRTLEISRWMRKPIRELRAGNEQLDFLLEQQRKMRGLPQFEDDLLSFQGLFEMMFDAPDYPGDELWEVFTTSWMEQFEWDEEFRNECINRLLAAFFDDGIQAYNMEARCIEGLEFVNPALEFALPDYSIGLAVISHLRCWTDSDLAGTVLLGYSSSQMYWHQAADFSQDASVAEHPTMKRIEDLIRGLPAHHPLVALKLQYLDELREETHE